jgi:subtilase family protein
MRIVLRGLIAACVIAAGTSAAVSGVSADPPARTAPSAPAAAPALPQWPAQHACTLPTPGRAQCLAIRDTVPVPVTARPNARPRTGPASVAGPSGLHPYGAADLQAAYRLPSQLLGARQTIGIVDAYDNPNAAADLASYRAANGLPPCDANFPCFKKVDQRGGTDYPQPDSGWALEESLDVDMASAICPNCTVLLVEADDNTFENLAAAVDEAVALGANVVSNSYGGSEYNTELADLTSHYNHPGVVVTASTGDWGFGVSIPAAVPGVIAVGGTTLYASPGGRSWTETAWAGGGSGCSAYAPKPSWQSDPSCGKRSVADVAAVADPATPVAVYDTFDVPGWVAVGGTSASSPIIAGVYALAGNTSSITPDSYLYGHRRDLFDVTSGTNGFCGDGELCTAGPGYDGPTGLGTPNGIGAF